MIHLGQRIDLDAMPFQLYVSYFLPNGEERQVNQLLHFADLSVPQALDRISSAAQAAKLAYERDTAEFFK